MIAALRRFYSALLALPLLLYLAIPTRNYYWDGIGFAIDIENHAPGAALIHPNHLVYSLSNGWLCRLLQALGFHTRSLFVMQTLNSVLAGLSVFLLYACLRARGLASSTAVAVAVTFGFTATWWRFATDANAYVPSIFLLLVSYLLLERSKSAAAAGLAHAVAVAFHQLAILFLPVAIVRLWRQPRALISYLACSLIPVLVGYVAAFRAISPDPTLAGLMKWVTYHSPDSAFAFHPLDNIGYTIRGTFRLFFGGKIGDFAGDPPSWAMLAATAVAALFFLVHFRRMRVERIVLTQAVWMGCYLLFLYFWMPQNTFYRLFYLPPLLMALPFLLRFSAATAWRFGLAIFCWNLTFVIYPQSRVEFNVPLRFALAQQKGWPAGTPILFHKFHPDLWTISYFNMQAAWIPLERPAIDELEKHLAYARTENKSLWMEATAYELVAADPAGRQWLVEHERPSELIEFRDEKHHVQFRCLR